MMLRFISLFVLSEHCVQDGQQFTHTVNQRHFFGFSGCWQMHVKCLYHRIKPGYHKRCHVQGCSCLRTRTGVVRPADMCGITGMLCELNCVLLTGMFIDDSGVFKTWWRYAPKFILYKDPKSKTRLVGGFFRIVVPDSESKIASIMLRLVNFVWFG